MFQPDAHLPVPNKRLIYLGACLIAGIRLARAKQVNPRVIPTFTAIDESISVAHYIFNELYKLRAAEVRQETTETG